MRRLVPFLLAGLAVCPSLLAQQACAPGALPDAAKSAIQIRHRLHTQTVAERDPSVPASVAAQLLQLKSALADTADAAFACADPTVSPEDLQATLATALHANLAGAAETVLVTKSHRDQGAYGSDLAVQVFPLFNSPRYVEVDFRYGIECGDDNLLLVYEVRNGRWSPVLRWSAPAYSTVSDAFGDFVLLTPLSGFAGQRNWRFVVAHGQPGCAGSSAPTRFDLDLLQPTPDPAHPAVIWHMEQPYLRSQTPRLSTTEDTLSFELMPPGRSAAHRTRPAPATTASFRYRVTRDNKVEPVQPVPAPGAQTSQSPDAGQSASMRSPQ